MNSVKRLKVGFAVSLFVTASLLSGIASAVPYYYVDWTSWDPGGGTATGTITPSSGPDVTVQFDALKSDGSHGSFLGVAAPSLWTPTSTYTSAQVDNASTYEGLQLVGDLNMTYRVSLSEAIKDPIMAIATLGSTYDSASYVFDSPFTILSQGTSCCWGNGTLTQTGNTLTGREGSGTIQFIGTYTTFSWTVPDPEYWHGFTFGIRTTERLEPTTVPEPSTLLIMSAGLIGLGLVRRRGIKG